jgi:hypothetical protein
VGVAVTTGTGLGTGIGGGWYFGGLHALRTKSSHGRNRRIVTRD